MQKPLNHGKFTFELELCIDHLKVFTISKTCDPDFDLRGQIDLQTSKIFVLKFQIDSFGILPLH